MVAHRDLAFQVADGFEGNADDNQDRGAAQRDVRLGDHREDDREDRDNAEEDSPQEGDLGDNLREVVDRGLPGTDAGDRAVVFADRVRNFDGG